MPGPLDLQSIDEVCTKLVREAGEIALGGFRTAIATENKGGEAGYDPVTEADRKTEAFLREQLSARFPDAEIVGEEHGVSGAGGSLRWVIDPIDGTKAYVSGVPLWGVLLGLVVDGDATAGWVRMPSLGETFAAARGVARIETSHGLRPIRTSSTTRVGDAIMYSTHSNMFDGPAERLAFEPLARSVKLQRWGGDCYSYCLLAMGHIDLVVEAGLHSYDITAIIPIVEAAGGVITNLQGQPPLEGGFVIAASTPQLHAEALALATVTPSPTGGQQE